MSPSAGISSPWTLLPDSIDLKVPSFAAVLAYSLVVATFGMVYYPVMDAGGQIRFPFRRFPRFNFHTLFVASYLSDMTLPRFPLTTLPEL